MKDLQKWAECIAPTLTHNDWRDVERDAYASTDEAEQFSPDYARALLEHTHIVAVEVLTTQEATTLEILDEGELGPMYLTMRPQLTAYGRQVLHCYKEHQENAQNRIAADVLRQLLTDMDGELPDWLRKEIEKRILDTVNS
jgi:hypothetical protein